MGHSNYQLTVEQKLELGKIAEAFIHKIEAELADDIGGILDPYEELENKSMNIEIIPMSSDSDGAKLAQLFAETDTNSSLLKENEALIEENIKLRNALSQVATNLRNGSCVSPEASLEFLTVDLPNEVKLVIDQLRKRHPTKEEALAQYHWLKENSTRNK